MRELIKSSSLNPVMTIRPLLGTISKPLAAAMLLRHGDKLRVFEDKGMFYIAKTDANGYTVNKAGTNGTSYTISTRRIYEVTGRDMTLVYTGIIKDINGLKAYELKPYEDAVQD